MGKKKKTSKEGLTATSQHCNSYWEPRWNLSLCFPFDKPIPSSSAFTVGWREKPLYGGEEIRVTCFLCLPAATGLSCPSWCPGKIFSLGGSQMKDTDKSCKLPNHPQSPGESRGDLSNRYLWTPFSLLHKPHPSNTHTHTEPKTL